MSDLIEPKKLDDKGRCCGRKPMVYKRPSHLFCSRCDASFDVDDGSQIANWAYEYVGEKMRRKIGGGSCP